MANATDHRVDETDHRVADTEHRVDDIVGLDSDTFTAANVGAENDHKIVDAHSRLRLVVLGGGSVGMTVANRLRHNVSRDELAIVMVDPRPYAQYPPFLPEAAAGSIEPRDVIAPHRMAARAIDMLQGKAVHIDHQKKTIVIEPEDGDPYAIYYDLLVIALGSVSRTMPIPGLAENAIGFKNIEEGIAIRNRVLNRMDVAASVLDPVQRARMLTFTFIGGGFAGIEAIAEIEDMARDACKSYPTLKPSDLHFVLVEGSDRILPEVSAESGQYVLDELESRNIDIHLKTFLNSCIDGHVVLSTGQEFDSDTIVWTAGIKANPVLAESSDLPVDKLGRVTTLATLQVCDAEGKVIDDVWAAGDCAAVPDIASGEEGKFCPPNAQFAIRQAKVLAENVEAAIYGHEQGVFAHKSIGVVASLGLNKGVAEFLDGKIKLHGWPAWMAHRAYHLYAMPTVQRRIEIFIGWLEQSLIGREIVSLGSVEDPRREFLNTAVPAVPAGVKVEQKAEASAATATSGTPQ
jgi:NADH dehydrogenase